MSTREPTIADGLRAAISEEHSSGGNHPSLEVLLAYSTDQLPSGEDEAVRDHLVTCSKCSAELLSFSHLDRSDSPSSSELDSLVRPEPPSDDD